MEESKNGRRDPPGARGGQRGVRWADLDGRSPLEHSARCALLPEENAILLRVVRGIGDSLGCVGCPLGAVRRAQAVAAGLDLCMVV